MMTSVSISQVSYTISDSLYVCYTLKQNRQIAVIFKEGERDKELVYLCENTLSMKDSLINCYKKDSVLFKGLEKSYVKAINECDSINAELYREYNELQIANEKKKMWLKGLATIGIIELILIIVLSI